MNPQIGFLLNKSLESLRDSNLDSAELYLKQAMKLQSSNPHTLRLLGVVSAQRGEYSDALKYFNNSLKSLPKNSLAFSNLGNVFLELKEYENALNAYDKSIKIDPKYDEAWSNKGNVLNKLKRYDEAIAHYDKALSLNPNYAEAWSNKGNVLSELRRYDEAIAHYDKALSLNPNYAEAWSNKGNVLSELRRHDEAIDYYDRSICLKSDCAEVWVNKGTALNDLKRYDEAIAHFDKAIILMPDYAEAWSNKGGALNSLKRHLDSAKCFLKSLELHIGDSYLLGQFHHQMMLACDWTDYEKNINEISNLTSEGRRGAYPFGFQGIEDSENLLKKCAEIYSNDKYPTLGNMAEHIKYSNKKIRIGYLSGEFRQQATSILMTRVWELCDRSKFEIFAFDSGWDDGSDYRQRINGAFSDIFDISRLSDLDAANLIQLNQIDILVDMNGFFGLGRQGIFSYKPAPIQVNYLGFPGTIGATYIDYIVADKVVLLKESLKNYIEKVVFLPNTYQANDNQRKVSDRKFSKAELGLPDKGFVFACFNNNYKITPSTFDSWMRILNVVEDSVLWLLEDNPVAKSNLIKEAELRDIQSSRLVFAERMLPSEHLARHCHADLFLDTLPYNAHTTASDALWAGLPILTLIGKSFAGRVAASLLQSIGLPELITNTQEEYEALAIDLAMNPQKLIEIKLRLAKNRLTTPLFDTPLFTKNLESAFIKMYERYQHDLGPDHISIS